MDEGNQSRVPGADGVTGQEQLEEERKIIISQRQQPMHDLDRNQGSSFPSTDSLRALVAQQDILHSHC